jgi:tetratricopeptide (TPR) repeat protein
MAPAAAPTPPVDVPETVRKAIALVESADDSTDLEALKPLIEELRELVTIVNEHEPQNESLTFIRGSYLAYIGRLGDALDDLTKYLESRTGLTDYRGHRQLGDVYLQLNYPTMAMARYESADRLKPNDSKILLGLAKASQQLGRKEKTAEYITRAVEAAPLDKRGPYLQFAVRVMIPQKKWDEADRYARDAMQRTRSELEAEPGKLLLLQTLDGLCGLRIQIAQGRLADDPKLVQPRLDIVDITREMVAIRKQTAVHEQLATVDAGLGANDPTRPVKLVERRAELLVELGRTDEARQAYEELLELDPNHAAAKAFLAEPSAGAEGVHAAQGGSDGGES